MTSLFPQPSLTDYLADAERIIHAGFEYRRSSALMALLSGGDDSRAAAAVASRHERFEGCVHIFTGIGIERNREDVRGLCDAQGWPLYELSADPGEYERIVLTYGFPGPALHTITYRMLKERPLRRFVTRVKAGWDDHIVLATGVRASESQRRMGTSKALTHDRARIYVAPLLRWGKEQVHQLLAERGIPRNPVSEVLGMSGECLCGAYAQPGEFDRIAAVCPRVAAQIEALEEKARQVGVHSSWEDAPPRKRRLKLVPPGQSAMVLCHGCTARYELEVAKQAHFAGIE